MLFDNKMSLLIIIYRYIKKTLVIYLPKWRPADGIFLTPFLGWTELSALILKLMGVEIS